MSKILKRMLIVALLAGVSGGLVMVWGGDEGAVASSYRPVLASSATAAVAPAVAAAKPAAAVPGFASPAEQLQTRELRRSALPQFLSIADSSIAKMQGDIAAARAHGAASSDIAAMESRLQDMQRMRQQVLARNSDISGPGVGG
jgi:hypothetical protein